jgi:chemotaxis regulatin CheY-phosphate phosphatase CheZ
LEPSISDDGLEAYTSQARDKIIAAHGATSQVMAAVPRQGALGGDGNEIQQAWRMFNRQVASTHHRKIEEAVNAALGSQASIVPHIPLAEKEKQQENDND